MEEVPGCVHEGVVVRGHEVGIEDMEVTMLLTVGALKFRTFVVWVSQGGSTIGGTTIMGTVWVEVVYGLAHVALAWNNWG